METEELAVMEQPEMAVASPLDAPSEVFAAAVQRREANHRVLIEWIRSTLVKDKDYYVIKDQQSLGKPGAEKVLGRLGLVATFPNLSKYENAIFEGRELTAIILRCEIVNPGGQVVAEGIGARTLKQDQNDLNKCLKMAKKSCMIDATLAACGLSEIFTQDMEGMAPSAPSKARSTGASAKQLDAFAKLMKWASENGEITDQQAKDGISWSKKVTGAKVGEEIGRWRKRQEEAEVEAPQPSAPDPTPTSTDSPGAGASSDPQLSPDVPGDGQVSPYTLRILMDAIRKKELPSTKVSEVLEFTYGMMYPDGLREREKLEMLTEDQAKEWVEQLSK